MITLLYFARLREAFETATEQLTLPDNVRTAGELLDLLRGRGTPWDTELAAGKPVRIAVNQTMASSDTPLVDGDEIALFPPVTGG